MNATQTMNLLAQVDLGNGAAAGQAAEMIQGMMPMLMMMGTPPQLLQKLRPTIEGSVLKLNIELTPEDVMFPSGGSGLMMDPDGI